MNSSSEKYDYIITGMGCAGLSLIARMIRSRKFSGKKILLIDKEPKVKNDRTWCFWEKENGFFQHLVFKEWDTLFFHSESFSREMEVAPYRYKMIRGIDFYNYVMEQIQSAAYVDVLYGDVSGMENEPGAVNVKVNNRLYKGGLVFNSILFDKPVLKRKEYYLLQHFKGWLIRTPEPVFDAGKATLMDFRIAQDKGTAFVYVMPFTRDTALVEYTLFTENLLKEEEYDDGLKEYIRNFLKIPGYRVEEEESGIIPMTNHRFPAQNGNIFNIGTAGGQTKASSGYTFQFIQKQTKAITGCLLNNKDINPLKSGTGRFHFYDSVLLDILYHRKLKGADIFTDLFKRNKPQQVFKFLDNETRLAEEPSLLLSLPVLPFFNTALKRLF